MKIRGLSSYIHVSRLHGSRDVRRIPELIPETPDRLDALRTRPELAADRGDVDVDRAVEDVGIAAQGGVDNVVAREHSPGLGRQEVQNAKLGRGQRHRLASIASLLAGDVDRQIAMPDDR